MICKEPKMRTLAQKLTIRNLEVDAVAVVCVAAVCIEDPLSTQAVYGLSRWDQILTGDTNTDMLLLTFNVGGGGHTGPVCLALIASLFTVCAVALQSCRDKERI